MPGVRLKPGQSTNTVLFAEKRRARSSSYFLGYGIDGGRLLENLLAETPKEDASHLKLDDNFLVIPDSRSNTRESSFQRVHLILVVAFPSSKC